jgi:hypothetical protein
MTNAGFRSATYLIFLVIYIPSALAQALENACTTLITLGCESTRSMLSLTRISIRFSSAIAKNPEK